MRAKGILFGRLIATEGLATGRARRVRRLVCAVLATSAISFLPGPSSAAAGGPTGTTGEFKDLLQNPASFANPPTDARPKVRWWWAAPYDQNEFKAEVDAIANAGFGGVEAAFNNPDWATQGERDSLLSVLQEAQSKGITVDMTLGASWPVTTPATAPATGLSEHILIYGKQDPVGPAGYSGAVPGGASGETLVSVVGARVMSEGTPDPSPTCPAPNPGCVGAPLISPVLDPASLVDLTSTVDSSGNISWTPPSTGHWILFGNWSKASSQNVMDHLGKASAEAAANYLDVNQIGPSAAPLLPSVGQNFFEDSLELAPGSDLWTPTFAAEFRQRRGYDLSKYLPLIFVNGLSTYPVPEKTPNADFDLPSGAGDRVRHDYWQTMEDLYVESHMGVWETWAKTHGMQYRTQAAYGNNFDVTRSARAVAESGGLADDESLNAGDPAGLAERQWRFAMDHYRAVAGGSHQGGSLEISTELGAMFWRDQQIGIPNYKSLMDKEWAAGVTRPIIHGFSYQPPGSAWPGRDNFGIGPVALVAQSWNQYNFPQWSMWRPLTDYWARGNMLLQQGHPQTDVAVYRDGFITTAATFPALATGVPNYQVDPLLPTPVLVTPQGHTIDDNIPAGTPHPFFDGGALERAGYTFEYIDPMGLTDANAPGDGVLYPNGPNYRAIVIDQRSLPAATAEAVANQAERGLGVVFVGTVPNAGTSAADPSAEDARVKAAVQRILASPRVRTVGTQADARDALLSMGIEPAARWSQPLPVYSQHRVTANADYWYLWNADGAPARFTGTFAATGTPQDLNLWTGAISPLAVYATGGGGTNVPIVLQPGETRVIAFQHTPAVGHVVATNAQDVQVVGDHAEVRDVTPGDYTLSMSDGSTHQVTIAPLPAPISPASWHLHVDEVGPPGPPPNGDTPHDLDVTKLDDWRNISGIKTASGTGTYTTTVALPAGWLAPDHGTYLDLGEVDGAMQVSVNGQLVAPDDVPGRRFDISAALRDGDNTLQVVVTTTLKNKLVAMAQSGDTSQAGFLAQPATQPYGLIGPVQFVPFGRADVALPGAPAAVPELPWVPGVIVLGAAATWVTRTRRRSRPRAGGR